MRKRKKAANQKDMELVGCLNRLMRAAKAVWNSNPRYSRTYSKEPWNTIPKLVNSEMKPLAVSVVVQLRQAVEIVH